MDNNFIKNKNVALDDYQLCVKSITPYPVSREKPILVFLHDSWGCIDMWGNFPEKLVELSGLNAIIYDRQGHGKSSPFTIKKRTNCYLHDEANILIQLLDRLNIETVVLYGHSDGASISLIAASCYPERIKGIISEGAHSFVEDFGKKSIAEAVEKAKHNNLFKVLEKYHGSKATEVFRLWHETWLSKEFADWTIVPLLAGIHCPVLAFQGECDEFGTIKQLSILKETIPAEVVITEISNARHTPRKENPEETMKRIMEFLISTLHI